MRLKILNFFFLIVFSSTFSVLNGFFFVSDIFYLVLQLNQLNLFNEPVKDAGIV